MPKQTSYETLTPEDIGGRYSVVVKIRPELPQDRMVKAQLAQAYRAPGVDGRPLMDDRTIAEDIIEAEHPDTIQRRIDGMLLPAKSKNISDMLTAAQEQQWMDDHPETMALADKRLGEALSLRPQELQAIIQLAVKQALGAQGAPQLLAQADAMAGGQPPMGMPGQGPVGMDPAALPSQMQLGADPAAQTNQDPAMLAASQAQRGRAQQPF